MYDDEQIVRALEGDVSWEDLKIAKPQASFRGSAACSSVVGSNSSKSSEYDSSYPDDLTKLQKITGGHFKHERLKKLLIRNEN